MRGSGNDSIAAHAGNYAYTIRCRGVGGLWHQNNGPAQCRRRRRGAPSNAQYLTLALDGRTSAERTLSFSKYDIADGGANGESYN